VLGQIKQGQNTEAKRRDFLAEKGAFLPFPWPYKAEREDRRERGRGGERDTIAVAL